MAEGCLYHTITLRRDPILLRFCTSVSASPHLANLVTSLHLPDVGGQILHGGHTSRLLLTTLASLRNLSSLTLRLTDGLERSGITGANLSVFQQLVSLRFPRLRAFSTNLSLYVFPMGLAFLRAHPLLADLDFGFSPVSHVRTESDTLAALQFSALRALACGVWFIHDRFAVPPALVHFHARDLDLEPGELPRIARLLGSQLVSLRVSERFAYHHEQRGGPHAVRLDELVGLFPRLRFLQLDMHLVAVPYIGKLIVNCSAERPESAGDRRRRREGRLTLAWVCGRRPWSSRVDMDVAPAEWDGFLKSTALTVLHQWDGYLERVVYRHTTAPWRSVALGEDGASPVYREERGMQDDEWKLT